MENAMPSQPVKRLLLKMMALGSWPAGCSAASSDYEGTDLQKRFRGISLTLVVDAVPGAELEGAVFYDEEGYILFASSVVAKRNRAIMDFPSPRIPMTVRVIWRDKPTPVWGRRGGTDYEGPIIGDYTIPIAERIPAAVLNDIRLHRGGLRLKFRLKPDGVLFGWDIERADGDLSRFDMPGGDFLETRY